MTKQDLNFTACQTTLWSTCQSDSRNERRAKYETKYGVTSILIPVRHLNKHFSLALRRMFLKLSHSNFLFVSRENPWRSRQIMPWLWFNNSPPSTGSRNRTQNFGILPLSHSSLFSSSLFAMFSIDMFSRYCICVCLFYRRGTFCQRFIICVPFLCIWSIMNWVCGFCLVFY